MPTLTTERLSIITFTTEMMKASLIGQNQLEKLINSKVPDNYPMEVYKQFLPYKIERFNQHPEENEWEGIIIQKKLNTVIGDIGFKGGPDEYGVMDLGYSILPEYQGKGYATEAAKAMIDWGLGHSKVKRITASCSSHNNASIRVLEKVGLKKVGKEDGEIYWCY